MSAILKQLRHPDLYVPDILEDILLPLPVKSLKRFQGVSKTWAAFISHPYFVQKHLTHLMKSNNNSLDVLLETRPLRSICTSSKDLKEDDAAPIATRKHAYPVMTPTSSVVIFGSVNGLICVEFDKTDIVLWNPSTGESKLPQNTIVHHVHDHASVFYGFGYDSKSEDYKYPKAIVEVFSLKSGSWRTQADYSDSAIEGQGCLVNETLNWVDYNVHAPLVRSFDLGEEKFSENIQCLCSIMRANSTFVGGILNIKNRLAVYSLTIDTFNVYKIWVKRNGEGHDSWTEVANVISDQFLTPVWISESGDDVLAIVGNIVAWYSPKEKIFTKATETLDYSFGATTYIETLVSPLTGSVAVSASESSGMAASTAAKEGGKEELLPQATVIDEDHGVGSVYGFGYEDKAKDYKVVRGSYKGEYADNGVELSLNNILEVFSLRRGSWSSTEVNCRDLGIDGHGCLVNGILVWIDRRDEGALRSFDLAEEKFSENVQPLCSIMKERTYIGGALNIDNCLAVYSFETSTKEYRIWVRKDLRVHDSWTEVAKVISDDREFLKPICVLEGGEVLAVVGDTVAWYSPKEKVKVVEWQAQAHRRRKV
ncbi:hypothetical protein ACLB2K_071358 [Fragaria x ananassa]